MERISCLDLQILNSNLPVLRQTRVFMHNVTVQPMKIYSWQFLPGELELYMVFRFASSLAFVTINRLVVLVASLNYLRLPVRQVFVNQHIGQYLLLK